MSIFIELCLSYVQHLEVGIIKRPIYTVSFIYQKSFQDSIRYLQSYHSIPYMYMSY